jgi:hypothetical protein
LLEPRPNDLEIEKTRFKCSTKELPNKFYNVKTKTKGILQKKKLHNTNPNYYIFNLKENTKQYINKCI